MPTERDPFRPPDAQNESPMELATPVSQPKPAPDDDPPLVLPKPRKQVVYRARPRSSWVMVVVLVFAAIGFATVFRFGWWRRENLIPELIGEKAPPNKYGALDMGDAVLVQIDVTPKSANAKITIDGEDLPSNPVRLPRGNTRHKLVISADGYEPTSEEFEPDKRKTIRVRLTKSKSR
jgi:hypothetical protein